MRGWNKSEAGRHFFVSDDTIRAWVRRADDDSLVDTHIPVNRFPDFVRYAVQQIKLFCPALGKVKIADMLTEKGYYVKMFPPTVDALKTVQNVGVFYFNTHGGFAHFGDGISVFGLQTTTPCNEENDEKYDKDLERHLLYTVGSSNPEKCAYAISDLFVSEYMSFSKNSLVFLASCNSDIIGSASFQISRNFSYIWTAFSCQPDFS